MPDQLDNPTFESENPYEDFLRAKIEIYQTVMELCEDIRSRIEKEGTDDVAEQREYAENIHISISREIETRKVSLKIGIQIFNRERMMHSDNASTTEYTSAWSTLTQSAVQRVISTISVQNRQAIAGYTVYDARDQIGSFLESQNKYDEIEELHQNFSELYHNIVNGTLPAPPPPPWQRQ